MDPEEAPLLDFALFKVELQNALCVLHPDADLVFAVETPPEVATTGSFARSETNALRRPMAGLLAKEGRAELWRFQWQRYPRSALQVETSYPLDAVLNLRAPLAFQDSD